MISWRVHVRRLVGRRRCRPSSRSVLPVWQWQMCQEVRVWQCRIYINKDIYNASMVDMYGGTWSICVAHLSLLAVAWGDGLGSTKTETVQPLGVFRRSLQSGALVVGGGLLFPAARTNGNVVRDGVSARALCGGACDSLGTTADNKVIIVRLYYYLIVKHYLNNQFDYLYIYLIHSLCDCHRTALSVESTHCCA